MDSVQTVACNKPDFNVFRQLDQLDRNSDSVQLAMTFFDTKELVEKSLTNAFDNKFTAQNLQHVLHMTAKHSKAGRNIVWSTMCGNPERFFKDLDQNPVRYDLVRNVVALFNSEEFLTSAQTVQADFPSSAAAIAKG